MELFLEMIAIASAGLRRYACKKLIRLLAPSSSAAVIEAQSGKTPDLAAMSDHWS